MRDFRIRSNSALTGGYALHAMNLHYAVVSNIVLDGIDGSLGNGYLCGGFWFDGAAGVQVLNPIAYTAQDGVRPALLRFYTAREPFSGRFRH